MDPILDKAKSAQNFLEKLANMIPGFSGYRERELRRDADRLQREYLSHKLGQNKKALDQAAAAATRAPNLDVINDIETARKRMDKVQNRILFADRGYSGFCSAVKVDEATLARVYQFDMSLIQNVDAATAAADALAAAPDKKAAVSALVAQLDAMDAALNEREAVLSGVK
jgi:hypothetical protein